MSMTVDEFMRYVASSSNYRYSDPVPQLEKWGTMPVGSFSREIYLTKSHTLNLRRGLGVTSSEVQSIVETSWEAALRNQAFRYESERGLALFPIYYDGISDDTLIEVGIVENGEAGEARTQQYAVTWTHFPEDWQEKRLQEARSALTEEFMEKLRLGLVAKYGNTPVTKTEFGNYIKDEFGFDYRRAGFAKLSDLTSELPWVKEIESADPAKSKVLLEGASEVANGQFRGSDEITEVSSNTILDLEGAIDLASAVVENGLYGVRCLALDGWPGENEVSFARDVYITKGAQNYLKKAAGLSGDFAEIVLSRSWRAALATHAVRVDDCNESLVYFPLCIAQQNINEGLIEAGLIRSADLTKSNGKHFALSRILVPDYWVQRRTSSALERMPKSELMRAKSMLLREFGYEVAPKTAVVAFLDGAASLEIKQYGFLRLAEFLDALPWIDDVVSDVATESYVRVLREDTDHELVKPNDLGPRESDTSDDSLIRLTDSEEHRKALHKMLSESMSVGERMPLPSVGILVRNRGLNGKNVLLDVLSKCDFVGFVEQGGGQPDVVLLKDYTDVSNDRYGYKLTLNRLEKHEHQIIRFRKHAAIITARMRSLESDYLGAPFDFSIWSTDEDGVTSENIDIGKNVIDNMTYWFPTASYDDVRNLLLTSFEVSKAEGAIRAYNGKLCFPLCYGNRARNPIDVTLVRSLDPSKTNGKMFVITWVQCYISQLGYASSSATSLEFAADIAAAKNDYQNDCLTPDEMSSFSLPIDLSFDIDSFYPGGKKNLRDAFKGVSSDVINGVVNESWKIARRRGLIRRYKTSGGDPKLIFPVCLVDYKMNFAEIHLIEKNGRWQPSFAWHGGFRVDHTDICSALSKHLLYESLLKSFGYDIEFGFDALDRALSKQNINLRTLGYEHYEIADFLHDSEFLLLAGSQDDESEQGGACPIELSDEIARRNPKAWVYAYLNAEDYAILHEGKPSKKSRPICAYLLDSSMSLPDNRLDSYHYLLESNVVAKTNVLENARPNSLSAKEITRSFERVFGGSAPELECVCIAGLTSNHDGWVYFGALLKMAVNLDDESSTSRLCAAITNKSTFKQAAIDYIVNEEYSIVSQLWNLVCKQKQNAATMLIDAFGRALAEANVAAPNSFKLLREVLKGDLSVKVSFAPADVREIAYIFKDAVNLTDLLLSPVIEDKTKVSIVAVLLDGSRGLRRRELMHCVKGCLGRNEIRALITADKSINTQTEGADEKAPSYSAAALSLLPFSELAESEAQELYAWACLHAKTGATAENHLATLESMVEDGDYECASRYVLDNLESSAQRDGLLQAIDALAKLSDTGFDDSSTMLALGRALEGLSTGRSSLLQACAYELLLHNQDDNGPDLDDKSGRLLEALLYETVTIKRDRWTLDADPSLLLGQYLNIAIRYGTHKTCARLYLELASEYLTPSNAVKPYLLSICGVENKSISFQFVTALEEFLFEIPEFEAYCTQLAGMLRYCGSVTYRPDYRESKDGNVCSIANAIHGYLLEPHNNARLYNLSRAADAHDERVALCAELIISERVDFDLHVGNRRQYCLKNFETRLRKSGSDKLTNTLIPKVLDRLFNKAMPDLIRFSPAQAASFFDRLARFFQDNQDAYGESAIHQGETMLSILQAADGLSSDSRLSNAVERLKSSLALVLQRKWPQLLETQPEYLLAIDDIRLLTKMYYSKLKGAGFSEKETAGSAQIRKRIEALANGSDRKDETHAQIDWMASLEFESDSELLALSTSLIEYGLSSAAERKERIYEEPSKLLKRAASSIGWNQEALLLRRFLTAFPNLISRRITKLVFESLSGTAKVLTDDDFALLAKINSLTALSDRRLSDKATHLRHAEFAESLLSKREEADGDLPLPKFHRMYGDSAEGSCVTYAAAGQYWVNIVKYAICADQESTPNETVNPQEIASLTATREFGEIYRAYPYGINRRLLKDCSTACAERRDVFLAWIARLLKTANVQAEITIRDLIQSASEVLDSGYGNRMGLTFEDAVNDIADPIWNLNAFVNLCNHIGKIDYANSDGKAYADFLFGIFLLSHDPEWVVLGFQECFGYKGERRRRGIGDPSVIRTLYLKMRGNELFDKTARAYLDALILLTSKWPDAEYERPTNEELVKELETINFSVFPCLKDDARTVKEALIDPGVTLRYVCASTGNVVCLRHSVNADDISINDALSQVSDFWRSEAKRCLHDLGLNGLESSGSGENLDLRDAAMIISKESVVDLGADRAIEVIDALVNSPYLKSAESLRGQDCEPVALGSSLIRVVFWLLSWTILDTLNNSSSDTSSNDAVDHAFESLETLAISIGKLNDLNKNVSAAQARLDNLASENLSSIISKIIASNMMRFANSSGEFSLSVSIARLKLIARIVEVAFKHDADSRDEDCGMARIARCIPPLYERLADGLNGGSLEIAQATLGDIERNADLFEFDAMLYDAIQSMRDWLSDEAIIEVDIEDEGGYDGNVYIVIRNSGGRAAERIVVNYVTLLFDGEEVEAFPYGVETADINHLGAGCEEAFVFTPDPSLADKCTGAPTLITVRIRVESNGASTRYWTVQSIVKGMQGQKCVPGERTFNDDARELKRVETWPPMYFEGRNLEYERLKQSWHLTGGSGSLPDGSILIYGSKGVGKTAFAKGVYADNRGNWRNCLPVYLVCESRIGEFRLIDLIEPLFSGIKSSARRLARSLDDQSPAKERLETVYMTAQAAIKEIRENHRDASIVEMMNSPSAAVQALVEALSDYSDAVSSIGGFKILVFVDEAQCLLGDDATTIDIIGAEIRALRELFVDYDDEEMIAFCFLGCGDALRHMNMHADVMRSCFGSGILLKRFEGEKSLSATKYLLGIEKPSGVEDGWHPEFGNIMLSSSAIRFLTTYTAGHARSIRKICNWLISEAKFPEENSPFFGSGKCKRVIYAGDVSLLLRYKYGTEDEWRIAAEIMEENFQELTPEEETALGVLADRISTQEASGNFTADATIVSKSTAQDMLSKLGIGGKIDVLDLLVNRGILEVATSYEGYTFSSEMYRRCAERIAKRKVGAIDHEPDTLELKNKRIEDLQAELDDYKDRISSLTEGYRKLEGKLEGKMEVYESVGSEFRQLIEEALRTPTYGGDHHEHYGIEKLEYNQIRINIQQNIQNVFGTPNEAGKIWGDALPNGERAQLINDAKDSLTPLLAIPGDSEEAKEAKDVLLVAAMDCALPQRLDEVDGWFESHAQLLCEIGLIADANTIWKNELIDLAKRDGLAPTVQNWVLDVCKSTIRSILILWLLKTVDSDDYSAAVTPVCRALEGVWKAALLPILRDDASLRYMVFCDRRGEHQFISKGFEFLFSSAGMGDIANIFVRPNRSSWKRYKERLYAGYYPPPFMNLVETGWNEIRSFLSPSEQADCNLGLEALGLTSRNSTGRYNPIDCSNIEMLSKALQGKGFTETRLLSYFVSLSLTAQLRNDSQHGSGKIYTYSDAEKLLSAIFNFSSTVDFGNLNAQLRSGEEWSVDAARVNVLAETLHLCLLLRDPSEQAESTRLEAKLETQRKRFLSVWEDGGWGKQVGGLTLEEDALEKLAECGELIADPRLAFETIVRWVNWRRKNIVDVDDVQSYVGGIVGD